MAFNSYVFVFLMLPISVMGYYLVNRASYKGGKIFLLICSMIFVGYTNILYVAVLIPSVLINYLCLYLLAERFKRTDKSRKRILIFGIVFDVFTLILFKYMDFFIDNINRIFKTDYVFCNLIMPLGISFYTFKQISCLIDYYRDKELNCSLIEYSLYISFYPHFVQGPITLQSEFVPQLRDESRKEWNSEYASKGLYRFTLGLAKKVLIADTIAKVVDGGYADLYDVRALGAAILILGYTLQIYFDFSAYSDMAVGLGLMFRLDLPENFDSPYKARNIDEFWDRWHITLTRFLTRYVYIPLGGSRKGNVRTYVNVMIVFFLSGLWHGADWSFAVWGLMHGVAMVVSRIPRDIYGNKIGTDVTGDKKPVICKISNAIKCLIAFCFVNIAWVFFRADNIRQASDVIFKLFNGGWNELTKNMYESFYKTIEVTWILRLDLLHLHNRIPGIIIVPVLITLTALCMFAPNSRECTERWSEKVVRSTDDGIVNKRSLYPQLSGIIIAVLFVWCVISFSEVTTYIYWNF